MTRHWPTSEESSGRSVLRPQAVWDGWLLSTTRSFYEQAIEASPTLLQCDTGGSAWTTHLNMLQCVGGLEGAAMVGAYLEVR